MACNNMFAVLSDNESDEEFVSDKPQQQNKQDGRSRAEKRSKKRTESKPTTTTGNDKKPNTNPKQKGVSSDPHPMDRHSGNGVGRRDKKDGSGKGNWGNYKDDVNEKDVKEDNENGEPVKAVEDNSLTYEEYLSKKATRVTKDEQVETKADFSQLLKEGCSLVERKEVDDKTSTKKTKHDKKSANYNVTINTENSDILGFRTGLQTYTLKDRENREPREERKPREEKETENTENTEDKKEGEAETEEKPKEQREHRGYRGGRGGRGGRGRGGKNHGYKNDGYKSQKKSENKPDVNFEDDSSFPKLA